jgi:hypothetical protein
MSKSYNSDCKRSHIPNKETAQVLKETDAGKNLVEYDTLDDFWKALGFTLYASGGLKVENARGGPQILPRNRSPRGDR